MKRLLGRICSILLCTAMIMPLSACKGGRGGGETNAPVPAKSAGTVGAGKRVYFAGPLFSQAEKDFNEEISSILEGCGYEVFLPQRDGIEAAQLEGKSEEELIRMIFELDSSEVKKADIIFMNLDGRVPDEGACVELGIAFASGKRCYGFKTDTRSIELGLDLNPMISGCMIKIFRNSDGEQLIRGNKRVLIRKRTVICPGESALCFSRI